MRYPFYLILETPLNKCGLRSFEYVYDFLIDLRVFYGPTFVAEFIIF